LGGSAYQEAGSWTVGLAHRWQYSDKHFVGDEEQVYREKEGSQVINNINIVDINVAYNITKRFALNLGIPFSFATRSQAVRDTRRVNGQLVNPSPYPAPDGTRNGAVIDRFTTEANGLGDIKLLATGWILDPDTFEKGNVSVGLGVLFPSGQKDSKDVFEVFDAASNTIRAVRQNVDNSIQPGGGAWGIIFDLYMWRKLVDSVTLFAQGTYIATPQETAGVQDRNPSTGTPQIWSTADAYLFRAGAGWNFWESKGLTFTLAGRMEGAPSTDIIGGSEGRRRPGFAISIEPGLVWAHKGWVASFSAPVALYRNRENNFAGVEGDAAFADFMTLSSLSYHF
jgi:hypothetical protein